MRKFFLWTAGAAFFALLLFLHRWEGAKDRIAIDVAEVKSRGVLGPKPIEARPRTWAEPRERLAAKPQRRQTFSAASLPSPNQPLRDIVERLKHDAAGGNYRASCRIATELMRCMILPGRLQSMEKMKSKLANLSADSDEYLRLSSAISRFGEKRVQDKIVCEGFENTENLEPWRYLFQAALGGHAPSMAQFVALPPWNPFDFVGNMEAWAAYKEFAGPFILAAAQAGDKGAVMDLAEAYAGNSVWPGGPLGGVKLVDVDPFMAAVYANASFAFGGQQSEINAKNRLLRQIHKSLTPEQQAAARIQSDSLVATWQPTLDDNAKRRDSETKSARSYDKMCEE